MPQGALQLLATLKQNGEDRFAALCMEGHAGAAGAEPDANSGLRRQVRGGGSEARKPARADAVPAFRSAPRCRCLGRA